MPLNIDWQQILLHLLNFTILAFGLYFILYKPVTKFMEKREKEYKEREEKTKSALDEAEKKEAEYNEIISSAEKEAAEIKNEAAVSAAAAAEEKKAQADKEAAEIVEKAKKQAAKERAAALDGAALEVKEMVYGISDKLASGKPVGEVYDEFLKAAEKQKDEKDE